MSPETPPHDRIESQEAANDDARLYPAWQKLCTYKGTVNNVPGSNSIGQVLRSIVPDYDHKMEYRQLPDILLKNVDAMRFLGDKSGLRRLNPNDADLRMAFWETCQISNGIATFYHNGAMVGTCNLAPEKIRLSLQHFNNKSVDEVDPADDVFADVNKVDAQFVYREGQDPLAMILDSLHVSETRASYLSKIILRKGSSANRWFDRELVPKGAGEVKTQWKDGMVVNLNRGKVTIQEKNGTEVGNFKLVTNEALGIARDKRERAAPAYVNQAALAEKELRDSVMRNNKLRKNVLNIDDTPYVAEAPKVSEMFPKVDGVYVLGSKDFDVKISQSGADFYKEIGADKITVSASHRRASNRVDETERLAVWNTGDNCYKYTDGKQEKVTFWNNYYYKIKPDAQYSASAHTPDDSKASRAVPTRTNDDL